jgi:signal transduction histidine kinase
MTGNDASSIEEIAFQRMAPVISHEIRNPLAVIGNSTYFIKSKLSTAGPLDPKIAKHLGIIESEVRRANETLSEILAFTRMREPVREPVDLGDLVSKTLLEFHPPGRKVLFDPQPAMPRVQADAEIIARSIAHLLRNAAEASSRGDIRISVSSASGTASIEVSDSGPGLSPEAASRLFTPFFTTKPRGIGLGLAFVRKAASGHGGRALVENRPGGGVSARIELPL